MSLSFFLRRRVYSSRIAICWSVLVFVETCTPLSSFYASRPELLRHAILCVVFDYALFLPLCPLIAVCDRLCLEKLDISFFSILFSYSSLSSVSDIFLLSFSRLAIRTRYLISRLLKVSTSAFNRLISSSSGFSWIVESLTFCWLPWQLLFRFCVLLKLLLWRFYDRSFYKDYLRIIGEYFEKELLCWWLLLLWDEFEFWGRRRRWEDEEEGETFSWVLHI